MLEELATQVMSTVVKGDLTALATLALITALMEAGLPFPFVLNTALLFVSFDTGLISLPVLMLMITLFLGRLIGSSVIFWLSWWLGGVFTNWMEKRSPSLHDKLTSLADKLNHRVPVAVTVARLTPGLLTASSVGAGVIRVNYLFFIFGIGLSSVVADGIVLLLGYLTQNGLKLFGVTPSVWQLVIGLMILISIGWGTYYLIRRRRQQNA